jgi:hypothetical protein
MRNDTSSRAGSPLQSARATGVHRRQESVAASLLTASAPPPALMLPAVVVDPVMAPPVAVGHAVLEPAVPAAHRVRAQKLAVSAYRVAGLSILTVIVVLLLGFIASTIFYLFSTTWIMPNTIMRGDVKAVAMATELAARQNERDALAAQLQQAESTVAMNQRFQLAFIHSVKADLERRKGELAKLNALSATAQSTTGAVRGTMNSYAAQNEKFLDAELAAGLVRGDQRAAGNFESAQVKAQSIGMAEQQAVIEIAADDMARETASLDAVLDDSKDHEGLAYDILKIEQQYMQSKQMLADATAVRDQLKASVAREDQLIEVLKSSVYVRALADKAMIAYVPYDNLPNAKPGTPLYSCKLGFVVCHRVGKVLEVLPGEVQFTHPHRDKQMRGQAVELELQDGELDAVQDDTLFVGGKPFLF